MTKQGVEEIVRRYPYIMRAIKTERKTASFYVGNRKHEIEITEEVRTVCNIIDDIYFNTENVWVRHMIDGLKAGKNDVRLISELPWERNAYYERKRKFIEKIYNCCISLQLVDYIQILKEEIA